jgi:hypothetical protein
MKKFEEITFNYDLCQTQFSQFRTLLETKEELGEAADILPFFRDRGQLAVLLGMFNPRIGWADRIAYEFDVFGDFACDLAVGEWSNGSYCFIEFEDAQKDSIFKKRGEKATREWAPRFDRGFSQIIDWCHKLHDRTNSADFVSRFGQHSINFEAVLVIGRDQHIDAGERLRLDWRSNFVMVNSKKVHCMTFDQLLSQLSTRLSVLATVAPLAAAPATPALAAPEQFPPPTT